MHTVPSLCRTFLLPPILPYFSTLGPVHRPSLYPSNVSLSSSHIVEFLCPRTDRSFSHLTSAATGELLAKERGIAAPLTFTQTRITFGNPPSLEAGKEYYFLLRLERGAFKFQATPHTSVALRASAYAPTTKDWIPSELSFVFRSTYAKGK